jgi:hypothetical protein
MGARARSRRQVIEEQSAEEWRAEYEARVEAERVAYLAANPCPCAECFHLQQHPSFGMWGWWHNWPEEMVGREWTCHHECHGADGYQMVPIAFA